MLLVSFIPKSAFDNKDGILPVIGRIESCGNVMLHTGVGLCSDGIFSFVNSTNQVLCFDRIFILGRSTNQVSALTE